MRQKKEKQNKTSAVKSVHVIKYIKKTEKQTKNIQIQKSVSPTIIQRRPKLWDLLKRKILNLDLKVGSVSASKTETGSWFHKRRKSGTIRSLT